MSSGLIQSEEKERMQTFVARINNGENLQLTGEDKGLIEELSKQIFADILDLDPEEITTDAHLSEDLGMDSLAFLEMFDEFKQFLNLDMDINRVAKYAQDNPAETFGEYMNQLYFFIEKPDQVLNELGLDRDEMIQKVKAVN